MIDSGQKSILVVDDEPDTAKMLSILLELEGYRVTTAHGTAQAIRAINTGGIDLVFLDIMLPDISGLEFCRYVRRDPAFVDLPIIVLSARARPEDIREGLETGANKYLTKPWGKENLFSALEEVLAI